MRGLQTHNRERMDNQKIIKKILREKSKGLRKFLKAQGKLIEKARQQPDEDWSVKRDPLEGRKQKELMIEASQYTIGYITAISDLIPEITGLLGKSEKQIKKILKDEKRKEKQEKKERLKEAEKNSGKTKIVRLKESHVEWCPLHGTGKPWATDPLCTCPGAEMVRKRMKKGDSLEDAKKHVAKKGLDVMF